MNFSSTLFTQTEDETLKRAAEILAARQTEAERKVEEIMVRLYRTYGPLLELRTAKEIKAADEEAEKVGQPRPLCHRVPGPKLDRSETLLLYALQRNRFIVEAHRTQSDRWNGDATCKYGVQEGAICIGATSRHDLLLSLWASVSGQDGTETIQLTEEHLNGAIAQAFLKSCRQADLKSLGRGISQNERNAD